MKDPKKEELAKSPRIGEPDELNANERAILNRMKNPQILEKPDWISVTVGQRISIAGLVFEISHISKGLLILELDSRNKQDTEEYAWEQLKCTGAKSLIRIDGTPFFVETRVLTTKNTEEGSDD